MGSHRVAAPELTACCVILSFSWHLARPERSKSGNEELLTVGIEVVNRRPAKVGIMSGDDPIWNPDVEIPESINFHVVPGQRDSRRGIFGLSGQGCVQAHFFVTAPAFVRPRNCLLERGARGQPLIPRGNLPPSILRPELIGA